MMDEEDFTEVVKYLKETVFDLKDDRLRMKYVQLYGWCRATFPERFEKQKPSLF